MRARGLVAVMFFSYCLSLFSAWPTPAPTEDPAVTALLFTSNGASSQPVPVPVSRPLSTRQSIESPSQWAGMALLGLLTVVLGVAGFREPKNESWPKHR